uniref:Uncharacterized protein n=1 Tax=Rhizophora mucronata TaxID=61149 RepID=A0A2P2PB20_RHIMU
MIAVTPLHSSISSIMDNAKQKLRHISTFNIGISISCTILFCIL